MAPVCQAFTRPKLIHGLQWEVYYSLLMLCVLVVWLSLWSYERLFLLPLVWTGPYVFFRWAGKHDPQWTTVYPKARRNRRVFLAGGDPAVIDEPWPGRALPKLPRMNPN